MVLGPIQKKWLKALKKYPERQHKFILGKKSKRGAFSLCCLGQLGLIAGHMDWEDSNLVCNTNKTQHCSYENYEDIGLKSSYGDIRPEVTVNGRIYNSLGTMNDGVMKWPDIAKFVEENPEMVFTKSI
jgi:hypothetical protein